MMTRVSSRAVLAFATLGAAATTQTVNPNDRTEVVTFYNNVYLPARNNTNHGWTGSTTGCNPGTLNAQFVTDSLTAINVYRAMAGMPNVTFGNPRNFATLYGNVDCQQGALMMQAANQLSHSLPPTGPCGTAAGSLALATSNLVVGFVGPAAAEAWVEDRGVPSLGHRRWLLHEPQRQMAMGSTSTYTAVDVMAATATGARTRFSAWPPAGFVPYPWAYDTWSFAVPGVSQGADLSAATVTVTRAGTPVPVTSTYLPGQCSNCYDNAIAWTFNTPIQRTGGMADTPYTVTIRNVAGAAQSTYTYVVTVIDPAGGTPDACDGATVIRDGVNGVFNNSTATNSLPAWTCGVVTADLWFSYRATCSGQTTFATCSPNLTLDTALQVFSGTCASLTSLACNDDFCQRGSSVTIPTVFGQTYKLRVGGFGISRGSFDVTVTPSGCAGTFQTLPHHCGTVTLGHTGTGRIGTATTFNLGGATGTPVMFFGLNLLSASLCPLCIIGPNPQFVVVGTSLVLNLPLDPTLVGGRVYFQGADVGGNGGCAAPQLSVTDTTVLTIG